MSPGGRSSSIRRLDQLPAEMNLTVELLYSTDEKLETALVSSGCRRHINRFWKCWRCGTQKDQDYEPSPPFPIVSETTAVEEVWPLNISIPKLRLNTEHLVKGRVSKQIWAKWTSSTYKTMINTGGNSFMTSPVLWICPWASLPQPPWHLLLLLQRVAALTELHQLFHAGSEVFELSLHAVHLLLLALHVFQQHWGPNKHRRSQNWKLLFVMRSFESGPRERSCLLCRYTSTKSFFYLINDFYFTFTGRIYVL